jgi:hypothetical protein
VADPIILVDFEFGFTSGEVLTVYDVQEGRDDVVRSPDGSLCIQLKPSPDVLERYEVKPQSLAWQKTTQRTLEQK